MTEMNRRTFLASTAAGASLSVVPGIASAAPTGAAKAPATVETIKGRVNPDGMRDKSGIIVSNGRDCTLTDANGNYTLPVYPGIRFITVTVPSGYRCEWPSLPYPRKWEPYNFFLYRWAPSAKPGCAFIHIADSEIGYGATDPYNTQWMDHVKRLANREDAAFIVHTGDICRWRGLHAHKLMMNEMTMGRPVVYCIGNHDLEAGKYGEEVFENIYGPTWYSFEAGGTHFMVTPMPYGDYRPGYTSDQVADWIRNDLALVKKGTPVVFFNHMISNWESRNSGDVGFTYGDAHKIRIDELCNYVGFVYGHVHFNLFRRIGKDGRTAFVCTANPDKGGIGHSPISTRVLRVGSDGRLQSRIEYGLADSWKNEKAGALWETKVDASVLFAPPLVANGRVYVGVSDEDGKGTGGVTALDAATGRKIWHASTTGSVHNAMALAAGLIIAQDTCGRVYAFDANTGAPKWRFEKFVHSWQAVYSGLVLNPEKTLVYVGTPMRLAALDVKTGSIVWDDRKEKFRIGEASSDCPACAEGVLVFASNWRHTYGYDAATGKMLWRADGDKDVTFRFPGATPAIDNGIVRYVGEHTYVEVDLKTGSVLRRKPMGARLQVTTKVVKTKHGLVFGSANKGLFVVDDKTLNVKRNLMPGPSSVAIAPYGRATEIGVCTIPVMLDEDRVAASCGDGAVHVWNLATGREERKFNTGAPYTASVTLADGVLYAADLAGRIHAFKI